MAERSHDVSPDEDHSRHSTASIRVQKLKRNRPGTIRFPKLDECAHFHYELVELQQVEVCQCI